MKVIREQPIFEENPELVPCVCMCVLLDGYVVICMECVFLHALFIAVFSSTLCCIIVMRLIFLSDFIFK
jgi:hypothetical protein